MNGYSRQQTTRLVAQWRADSKHDADTLITLPQYDIAFDDDQATKLIEYLMDKEADRRDCKSTAPGWLPERRFAKEELPIKVTAPGYGKASKQRILACGEGADGNSDQRRIARYEAAAEINETARINRDCSTDGCPGIGYYCDAAKCYRPVDQLKYGPPHTTEPVYTPSYGRSQFIGTTLVGELIAGYANFSATDKAALGLTPAIKKSLEDALERGKKAGDWFDAIAAQPTYADANAAWSKLSVADQKMFAKETGLGEREYTDMARMKTQPPRNSNGKSLLSDARAAMATTAIMRDAALKTYLMGIFKDYDKFTIMAKALMHKNAKMAQSSAVWDKSEVHLAAMVARAHNGGKWERSLSSLTSPRSSASGDQNHYVKRFLGDKPGEGDWYSLRCAESFGKSTVRPGMQGKGVGGLQMIPLVLN
ncbi:hypothetical protein [Thiobacter aerophilum]|uniref:Uncharacterized protein n=1 Tax=Thiobacter aerophilum TaxID=3121275 RepID=A0ABV0EHI9_9BURK